jgi:ankyrin repeat protein
MCQLTFAMYDRERVVEEVLDAKPEATSDAVSGDAVGVADSMQQKNRKSAKGTLYGDQKSKKDREEHFLFRNIHYHREILVSKAPSAPESSAQETHRKFGIHELPPLHQAAAKASLKVIADLLEKGMDVNEKIPFSMRDENMEFRGASPLHIAAWFGKTKAIDFLLEHGANVNSLDSNSAGVLIYAMWGPCRGRIVMPLLSTYGADPNIRDCWGNLPLHSAAAWDISLLIHPLVEAGNDLNDQNTSGSTPLKIASGRGHEQAVQALLDLGADTTICDNKDLWNPLHVASYNGSKAVVDMLLQEAPNLMAPDVDGDTALHLAALQGHDEIALLLLDHGADVNSLNELLVSPLHKASANGHDTTLRLLLQHSANPCLAAKGGLTALHFAMSSGHESIAKYLLGLDTKIITISDEVGYSYLHYAAMYGLDLLVKLLLDGGLDIEALPTLPADSNFICGTPLALASRNGQTTAAKELLNHGANIHARCTQTQESSLHMAVIYDHTSTVKLLIERGASTECRCVGEETPLISGSRKGCRSIGNLLDAGADVNACDEGGCNALHWACFKGHEFAVKQLLASGAQSRKGMDDRLPLHDAAIGVGSELILQLLLQHFPESVNVKDTNGSTALHTAAFKGNLPLVNLLLENGADMEAENNLGEIPLDHAVYNGSEPIVQLLLQQNPHTIKARANDGKTLLHYAARGGHLSIIKLLLMTEPNLLDAEDSTGRTALFRAVFTGRKEIVEFLLQHGCQLTLREIGRAAPWDFIGAKVPMAEIMDLLVTHGWDVDERYDQGRTALHVAVINGDEETARSLISHGSNLEIGDDDGDTALDIAIMSGEANMETLIREALQARKSTSLGSTIP